MRKVRDQRWLAARLRLRAERESLSRFGKRRPRMRGRILAYHGTGTPEWGVNDVSADDFKQQVEHALSLGYRFEPAEEIARGNGGPFSLAITFDDGLRSILAVTGWLAERHLPFTVFVVTEWAGEPADLFLSWDELGELAAAGASIGSHSLSHRNFRSLSATERRDDLQRSRYEIEKRLGHAPEGFAIPFGRRRDWDMECTELARIAGYESVYAQAESRRPRGTVGRSFVTRYDRPRQFQALLEGRFDHWEEWF
jgi:peptidoglycan/xylan/chitin deacetylase (PgdA/CDA1 family)